MSTAEFLKKLPTALKADAVDGVEFIAQLNIASPVYVNVNNGVCTVAEGTTDDADVTLTLSDENMIALLTGKMAGLTAFMSGKLKIDGDLMLAKEIPDFFDPAKLV